MLRRSSDLIMSWLQTFVVLHDSLLRLILSLPHSQSRAPSINTSCACILYPSFFSLSLSLNCSAQLSVFLLYIIRVVYVVYNILCIFISLCLQVKKLVLPSMCPYSDDPLSSSSFPIHIRHDVSRQYVKTFCLYLSIYGRRCGPWARILHLYSLFFCENIAALLVFKRVS